MMHPVIRVLAERAASRRVALLGLVSVIPEGSWTRSSVGDRWTAHQHLAHALTADRGVAAFISSAESTLAPDIGAVRDAAMLSGAALPLPELLASGDAARGELIALLASFAPTDLDRQLVIPGVITAWGEPITISLYRYLEQWAGHDGIHEAAIRDAIATSPDLTAIAMTRRRR